MRTMNFHHTNHSWQACRARGIDPAQAEAQVNQVAARLGDDVSGEVIVVIHALTHRVLLPGGEADCIAAFLDSANQTIKTVCPQRWAQLDRKAQHGVWVNPEIRGLTT